MLTLLPLAACRALASVTLPNEQNIALCEVSHHYVFLHLNFYSVVVSLCTQITVGASAPPSTIAL
jgi:hypothetical protein